MMTLCITYLIIGFVSAWFLRNLGNKHGSATFLDYFERSWLREAWLPILGLTVGWLPIIVCLLAVNIFGVER